GGRRALWRRGGVVGGVGSAVGGMRSGWGYRCGGLVSSYNRSLIFVTGPGPAETMIATGQALEKFRQGIRLQGGDERVIDEPERLPTARLHFHVSSSGSGFITGANCEQFGIALAMLGGGREKKEDQIDHGVGLEFHKRIGDPVKKGEPLATIH